MPAFKKLGPGDQIDNVLVLEPQWTLASGSGGWKGAPEGGATIHLFEGAHRQPGGVIREYQYEPIIPASHTFGDMRRSNPITASLEMVWMTNEDLNLAQRSRTRWGYEHWKVVDRLYQLYYPQDVDYTTTAYDHYCLFFDSGSQNIVTVYDRYATGPDRYSGLPTASFTVEAWFKPFVTSSAGELTVLSHARGYKLYIEGSTGKLVFAANSGSTTISASVTSSHGVSPREWHHAAVSFDATSRTGTLYLDLVDVGSIVLAGGIPAPNSYTGSLQVGGSWGGAVSSNAENPGLSCGATLGSAFHGFIGETRVWSAARTYAQISATHNVRLTGSTLLPALMSNVRFSEGPLAFGSPSSDPSGRAVGYASGNLMGSGVLDYAAHARGASPDFGVLYKFGSRVAPVWHPSDNVRFYPTKQFVQTQITGTNWTGSLSPGVQRMWVFHVPSAFYGRQIQPGTVRIEDWAYSKTRVGLVRTLVDDGRGGLYLSGSAAMNPTGRARAVGVYSESTASVSFESRQVGADGNSYSINQTAFGSAGNPNFAIDESDPTNVTVTIPTSDGVTPMGTFWDFYQFMATSSIYVRPTAVTSPGSIINGAAFTMAGGADGNPTLSSSGSYRGVEWNKVGNVFYSEGIVTVTDPTLLDMGNLSLQQTEDETDVLRLSFRGHSRVPVKTVVARIERGELNRSLNSTVYDVEEDGYRSIRNPSGSLYVTSVGLYNSDRELVGVARFAEPIRVRPRDRYALKIRMDF